MANRFRSLAPLTHPSSSPRQPARPTLPPSTFIVARANLASPVCREAEQGFSQPRENHRPCEPHQDAWQPPAVRTLPRRTVKDERSRPALCATADQAQFLFMPNPIFFNVFLNARVRVPMVNGEADRRVRPGLSQTCAASSVQLSLYGPRLSRIELCSKLHASPHLQQIRTYLGNTVLQVVMDSPRTPITRN